MDKAHIDHLEVMFSKASIARNLPSPFPLTSLNLGVLARSEVPISWGPKQAYAVIKNQKAEVAAGLTQNLTDPAAVLEVYTRDKRKTVSEAAALTGLLPPDLLVEFILTHNFESNVAVSTPAQLASFLPSDVLYKEWFKKRPAGAQLPPNFALSVIDRAHEEQNLDVFKKFCSEPQRLALVNSYESVFKKFSELVNRFHTELSVSQFDRLSEFFVSNRSVSAVLAQLALKRVLTSGTLEDPNMSWVQLFVQHSEHVALELVEFAISSEQIDLNLCFKELLKVKGSPRSAQNHVSHIFLSTLFQQFLPNLHPGLSTHCLPHVPNPTPSRSLHSPNMLSSASQNPDFVTLLPFVAAPKETVSSTDTASNPLVKKHSFFSKITDKTASLFQVLDVSQVPLSISGKDLYTFFSLGSSWRFHNYMLFALHLFDGSDIEALYKLGESMYPTLVLRLLYAPSNVRSKAVQTFISSKIPPSSRENFHGIMMFLNSEEINDLFEKFSENISDSRTSSSHFRIALSLFQSIDEAYNTGFLSQTHAVEFAYEMFDLLSNSSKFALAFFTQKTATHTFGIFESEVLDAFSSPSSLASRQEIFLLSCVANRTYLDLDENLMSDQNIAQVIENNHSSLFDSPEVVFRIFDVSMDIGAHSLNKISSLLTSMASSLDFRLELDKDLFYTSFLKFATEFLNSEYTHVPLLFPLLLKMVPVNIIPTSNTALLEFIAEVSLSEFGAKNATHSIEVMLSLLSNWEGTLYDLYQVIPTLNLNAS